MSAEADLIAGLAQLLGDNGVADVVPDGQAAESFGNPVIDGALPPEVVRGVALNAVKLGVDDPAHPTTTYLVQFYLRGARAQIRETAAGIDALINGMQNHPFGEVTVAQVRTQSDAPMGTTPQGLWERAIQYRVDLDLPDTALRSY